MKKSIFLFLLAFMSLTANAQDPVKIDGLWYELGTDYNNMLIAKVVSDPNKVGYSGNVRIPKNVSYGGETYNVNEISSRAFCGTDGIGLFCV